MAFVERPTIEVVYSFRDIEGSQARMQLHMPNSLTILSWGPTGGLDEVELWAVGNFGAWALGGLISAVQPLTDCEIFRASLSQTYYDDAIPAGAGEAEQWGTYQFADQNNDFFELHIPDPPEAILQPNLRSIDPAHADVVAFVGEILLDKVLDTKSEVINYQGLKAQRLVDGWKSHRSSIRESYRRTG
jgi:hypothetical protein